ncbi:hypothetical protein KP509_16G001400 [Ceratopteris richardii]|uniref:Uncharacterized protein n=1 Tax=Ceratopteris richardii TaxID=49495 RepID=A0A8T2SZ33_CERRI|nr:hypothetical protein KP509_16G001400 [Ceratopteris richardii]
MRRREHASNGESPCVQDWKAKAETYFPCLFRGILKNSGRSFLRGETFHIRASSKESFFFCFFSQTRFQKLIEQDGVVLSLVRRSTFKVKQGDHHLLIKHLRTRTSGHLAEKTDVGPTTKGLQPLTRRIDSISGRISLPLQGMAMICVGRSITEGRLTAMGSKQKQRPISYDVA